MSRKKRRKSEIYNLSADVKGIVYITLGVLVFFSIFLPSSSGIVGEFIKKASVFIFGIGAYIFPFIIIFIGIIYILKKGNIKHNSKFYGLNLFFINTLLFSEMIVLSNHYDGKDLFKGVKIIYNYKGNLHGGVLAYLIDVPLYKLFGNTGCYIIFISLYMISFIIMWKISLRDAFVKVSQNLKKRNEQNKLRPRSTKVINNVENITEKKPTLINLEESLDKKQNINKDEDIKIINFEENNKETLKNDKEDINEQLSSVIKNTSLEDEEYVYPHSDLLNSNENLKLNKNDKKDLINNANKLEETLNSFGVEAKVLQVTRGPSVTRFELQPEAGVKVSKIVNLSDDIALNLAASTVRIEAPIPGKSAIGIEVPNKDLMPVYIREVIESDEFKTSDKNLAFCLGKDIGGKCVVADLVKMPHLLVAGATGSGKSVCINTLIISLLYKYSPKEVKLLLIDPKVVELNIYNGIPHLLIPVVTDPKKAAGALNWAVTEMTRRYKLFADNNVRNIEGYNELHNKGLVDDKLPAIVVIIDELADLMMVCPGEVEDYIGRLAQMARAAGMHLVIATQRPSVDVITGVIKANIPSRISFSVSSQIDSRTILDSSGAEKLLGKGDMLFYPVGASKPMRVQGAFISEEEVEKVVDFVKVKSEEVQYREEIMEEINTNVNKIDGDEDELIDEAITIVINEGQASTSMLQRKLKIGYNRAARIIDQMEEKGIISGRNGSKPRQVLISKEEIN